MLIMLAFIYLERVRLIVKRIAEIVEINMIYSFEVGPNRSFAVKESIIGTAVSEIF